MTYIYFSCFSHTPTFVIVGDSNLVRLEDQVYQDELLSKHKITLHCKPGFRAAHLEAEDVVICSQFDCCILFLGNNDISRHPTKRWIFPQPPLKTAAGLCGFAKLLMEKGVKVKIVGLLPRPDISYELVKETNWYMQNFCGSSYVRPRKIHHNHFLVPGRRDLAHLNFDGRKRVLSLFLRICETGM